MLTPQMQELLGKEITEKMISQAVMSHDIKSEKWLIKICQRILPMIVRKYKIYSPNRIQDLFGEANLALVKIIKRIKIKGLQEGQPFLALVIATINGKLQHFLCQDHLIQIPMSQQRYCGKTTNREMPLNDIVFKEAYAMNKMFENAKLDKNGNYNFNFPQILSIHSDENPQRGLTQNQIDITSWYDQYVLIGGFEGKEDFYTFLGLSYFEICCLELLEGRTFQEVGQIVKVSHVMVFKVFQRIKEKVRVKYHFCE